MLQLVRSVTQENETVQRRAKIVVSRTQLLERAGNKFLRLSTNASGSNSQTVLGADTFLSILLDLEHLRSTLADSHVARRFVNQSTSSHVLQALLLDLDVDQDQRVQPNIAVLLYPVVERCRLPGVREENHGNGLAKVVKLETAGADAGQDGCIRDGSDGDLEFSGT